MFEDVHAPDLPQGQHKTSAVLRHLAGNPVKNKKLISFAKTDIYQIF